MNYTEGAENLIFFKENKVNYAASSSIAKPVLIWNNGDLTTYDSCSCIIYSSSENHIQSNITYIDLNPIFRDGTITYTCNSYVGTLIYNIIPGFTGDITEITSNDTITFTVSVGDQSFVKSFQLLPQCINFFNLFDMITITSPVKLFTITASVVSNAQLQLFKYTDSHSLMFAIVAL